MNSGIFKVDFIELNICNIEIIVSGPHFEGLNNSYTNPLLSLDLFLFRVFTQEWRVSAKMTKEVRISSGIGGQPI